MLVNLVPEFLACVAAPDPVAAYHSYLERHAPVLTSFIGGLGGRDISPEEFYEMANLTREAAETGQPPPPRLLYTEEELRDVRKLQAIAQAERIRLGGTS